MLHELGRRWRTARRLTWAERRLMVEAIGHLSITTLALRLFGFQRTQSALIRSNRTPRTVPGERHVAAARIAAVVTSAGHYCIGRPRCLPQALTLQWLMRRQGLPAELRIGVRQQGDRMEAHAWVECEGSAFDVAGGGYRGFAPFEQEIMARQRGAS
jgi:hypothetical protein